MKKLTYLPNCIGAILGLIILLYGTFEFFTPFQIIGLALLGYNVYKIIKIKSQPNTKEDALYREEDDEHSKEIRKIQATIKLVHLVFIILCIISVGLLIAVTSGSSVVPLIIVAIIAGIIKLVEENYKDKLKKYVADNITRQALDDVFDIEQYNPFASIPRYHIDGSSFGIGSFDYVTGSDYVKGRYKGLPIEISDVKLIEEQISTDENGNEQKSEYTVFQGLWLVCDFGKELSADMRLWERGKLGKLVGGDGIKTENDKFNKRFRIESEVEVEAFYILTPHMMEYILEMDDKAKGETHIRFERGGKVQIAIGRKHDSFEVGKNVKDATLLRKQFVQEIRYITDLIDELRLVDTLYKK